MATYQDITSGTALDQIIAAYKLDDGRPYFSIEISHLDDRAKKASSVQIQLNEPREADAWLKAIRTAAEQARMKHGYDIHSSTIEHGR